MLEPVFSDAICRLMDKYIFHDIYEFLFCMFSGRVAPNSSINNHSTLMEDFFISIVSILQKNWYNRVPTLLILDTQHKNYFVVIHGQYIVCVGYRCNHFP